MRLSPKAVRGGVAAMATCLGLGLGLAPAVSIAAAPAAKAPAAPGPKGPGSIHGLWSMTGYVSSVRPARERAAKDENGAPPPFLPEAKALFDKRISDADEHGKIFANTAFQCLPQGIPFYLFGAITGPLQILETPGQVTFISEEFNEIWLVYLNQKHRPPEDQDATFHGESVAHWEGDTLVIDTIKVTDRTTIDQVGTPHSEDMRVTTRAKRLDADTLEFRVTIDDPKTFSRPWTRKVIYKKAKPGERVEDYACDNIRNNVDAEGYQSRSLD